ncbi:MAG: hypothetical protein R2780_13890 [Crocinitomicaceae bacterium]
MKLLRVISIILICWMGSYTFGQKVKVDALNREYEKFRVSDHFDFIHDDFDTAKLIWVADLTVSFDTIIPGMIGETFNVLKERSNKMGANAFKVRASNIYDAGSTKYISISAFWLHMEDRDSNEVLFRSPEVYVFGFLGYHEEIDGYDIEVNKDQYVMHALTYRKRSFAAGDHVNIQLGSKTRGAEVQFKAKEDMVPKFYYFSMIRGAYKNAIIKEYDKHFGMYLTRILQLE